MRSIAPVCYLTLRIDSAKSRLLAAILDSGAELNIIGSSIYTALGFPIVSTNIQLRPFDRILVGLEGIVEANGFIRGCEEKVIFYIVDDYVRKLNYEVLLGILFIL